MKNKPKEVDEGDDRQKNSDWPYYTERVYRNTWSWSKWKEVFGRGRDDDD